MNSIVRKSILALATLAGLSLPLGVGEAVRSASIANLTLAPLTYSHVDRVNNGTMVLTASDDGTLGWNVTVQASAFTYSGANSGSSIPASSFSIVNAKAPTRLSGQAIDGVGGPKAPASGATGSLNTPRKVLQAFAGFGQGSYRQELDVALEVPGRSRAGTYTSTITVTIAAGP